MVVAGLADIRAVLETHTTMTLATAGDGRPWAATVFYASDPDLNLYFVSDVRTRHGRDLVRDPNVVGSIHRDVSTWDEVLGIQVEGHAVVIEGVDRDRGLQLYLDRFPDVRRLFDAPRNESESLIAARLRKTPLWQLTPRWLRLIDNGRAFGWKHEVALR